MVLCSVILLNMFSKFPIELIFAILAVSGGVARYLNGYANGAPFKFSIFIASIFVAGFSGYMFALLGTSLSLPQSMLYMMAGTGGFMGEQSIKLIMEYLNKKIQ